MAGLGLATLQQLVGARKNDASLGNDQTAREATDASTAAESLALAGEGLRVHHAIEHRGDGAPKAIEPASGIEADAPWVAR
jgi:hypothetical protein